MVINVLMVQKNAACASEAPQVPCEARVLQSHQLQYRSSTELASCLREVRSREKVAQVYACCILVWSTKSFFVLASMCQTEEEAGCAD